MSERLEEVTDLIRRSRARILRMHYEAGVGHIGGNLSVIDLLICLYHRVMTPNDQFILSKGHSAGALYVTLWSRGLLSEDELKRFHKDGTRLSAHPPAHGLPEILFATGSLGHGVGLGAGLALAKKFHSDSGHVFVVTSDGEWNEGSSWEGLIFARQQKLDNLTIIVDLNGMQGFGSTQEVADLSPIEEKFKAFYVDTVKIDGHDPAAIISCLSATKNMTGPRVVVAVTRKGRGISFMENKMEWHYLPLNEQLYRQTCDEECGEAPSMEQDA